MPQRVRLPDQNKPIIVDVKRASDNSLIQSFNTSADEITLPTITEGFYYTATNSIGTISTRVIDNATRILQMKNHIGRSVADGNTLNHINGIALCAARAFTFCGCVFAGFETDAEMIAFESATYDHTVSTGSYAHPFDEVVRTAYLTNSGDLSARVSLRVSIEVTRPSNKLNNGSTRTLFYSLDDCNKRPDGSLTVKVKSGVVPSTIIPSYGSPVIEAYVDRILTAFIKRYVKAINDGTIFCIGLATTSNAEAEYPAFTEDENGNIDGDSHGDFHAAVVAKFKSFFPIYTGVDNNTIYNNDLNGSDLGKRWWASLAKIMSDFERNRIAYAKAHVTGLTRVKFWQKDVGSFSDGMAARRRTYNCFYDLPDEIMVIKSNDDTGLGADGIKFALEDLHSRARLKGACCLSEPTPAGGDFVVNRGDTLYFMGIMKQFGIGMSFVSANPAVIDDLRFASNFQQFPNPLYKNEFNVVSTNKKLARSVSNLSDLLGGLGMGNKRNAWSALKISSGLERVDIVTFNDII